MKNEDQKEKDDDLVQYSELTSIYIGKGKEHIDGLFEMALSKIARHKKNNDKTFREKKFKLLYAELYQQAKNITEELQNLLTVENHSFSKEILENTLDLLETNPFSKKKEANQTPDKNKLKNYNTSLDKFISQLNLK